MNLNKDFLFILIDFSIRIKRCEFHFDKNVKLFDSHYEILNRRKNKERNDF